MINRGDQEGLSAKPFPGPYAHTCVDNPREICPACKDSELRTPITDFDLEQSRR